MEDDNELAVKVACFYQKLCEAGLEPWVAITLTQHYLLIKSNQEEKPTPLVWPQGGQG